ncbi:hypothetical protein OROGR_003942 [Orobanche gracilis]
MKRRFEILKSPEEYDRNPSRTPGTTSTTTLPYLPDNVVEKILSFLHVDLAAQANAVSKQWSLLWPSFHVLDFDEGDPSNSRCYYKRRHFVGMLRYGLRRCTHQKLLKKLRIRADCDLGHISPLVDQWIEFAIERCVEELVIQDLSEKKGNSILIAHDVLKLKSLTTLNLENVRLYASSGFTNGPVILPLLKTMTLMEIRFLDDDCDFAENMALPSLVSGCPTLQQLSVDNCNLGYSTFRLEISSNSLKSLEIMHCHSLDIDITAANLESFTFFSDCTCPYHKSMYLWECNSLEHVDISCRSLKQILLHNGLRAMDNSFRTPNLVSFEFSGYLKTKIHFVEAPSSLLSSTIRVWETSWPVEYYSALRHFLDSFDCSEKVKIHVQDDEGVMIPEQCRTGFPPLPNIKQLQLYLSEPLEEMEYLLRPSLIWMAPSAEILPFLDHDYDDEEWLVEDGDDDGNDDDDDDDDDIDDANQD